MEYKFAIIFLVFVCPVIILNLPKVGLRSFVHHIIQSKQNGVMKTPKFATPDPIIRILQSIIKFPSGNLLHLSRPWTIDFSQFGQSKVLDRILGGKRGNSM